MDDLTFSSVLQHENFVDLVLWQMGRGSGASGGIKRNVQEEHFLFIFMLSGAGSFTAEGRRGIKTFYVRSNQGFMAFPGQSFSYSPDSKAGMEYVWVEFGGLRAGGAVRDCGLTADEPLYHGHFPDMRETVRNEMVYLAGHKDMTPHHLTGHLYLFLDALSRSVPTPKTKGTKGVREVYVREALEFIEKNFQNDISVEDIADFCGLNRSYFGAVFKELMGKTTQEFLLNYRMAKAAELLRQPQYTVGDIGNAVGYRNPLHFSRAFKNLYGVSPRAWRNGTGGQKGGGRIRRGEGYHERHL